MNEVSNKKSGGGPGARQRKGTICFGFYSIRRTKKTGRKYQNNRIDARLYSVI
ncbi:MAG: hypothetical protein LBH14_02355 [Desulfobulbaceae bacterium]|jgi:hypothetical protein|nr:hypothetical protein [Desulfobulbaceae bacterium]